MSEPLQNFVAVGSYGFALQRGELVGRQLASYPTRFPLINTCLSRKTGEHALSESNAVLGRTNRAREQPGAPYLTRSPTLAITLAMIWIQRNSLRFGI